MFKDLEPPQSRVPGLRYKIPEVEEMSGEERFEAGVEAAVH